MASDYGRHDADDSASDRARVDYLAGETNVELDPADQAELDELRELLDTLLHHARRQAVERALQAQQLRAGLLRIQRHVLERGADA